jgi:hypothetical protein
MAKSIVLVYFDPLDSKPSLIAVGPFATHEEAAEVGACEHTTGMFWTTEMVTPED